MTVSLHAPDTIDSRKHLPSWLFLACAAGSVNGFAFLTCEQYVSHVTGTMTRMGLEWHHVGLAVEYLVIALCFLAGAITSVIWIQARASAESECHPNSRLAVDWRTILRCLTSSPPAH